MGGNGSFIRRDTDCEDGRKWKTIASCGKIQILQYKNAKISNKLPEESHTPGRIYATFRKDGKDVGSIAQYGKDGKKIWEIHTSDHHFGDVHYHKWVDLADGKRGQEHDAHKLTKQMKRILRQVRNFNKTE